MEFFMMKKTAIALGIASMAFGAQAAEWMVTPDHKLELNGTVGAYYFNTKSTTGVQSNNFLGSGQNQIQLRSTKTLADGVKLIGQLEVDFDPIQDNFMVLTDDMRIGVDVPVWGRLTAGQFDSFHEDKIPEALGFWQVGENAYMAESLSTFESKNLEYYNKYGAFEFAGTAQFGYDNSSAANTMMGYSATLGYKVGDLQIYLGNNQVPYVYSNAANTATTTAVASSTHTYSSGITANYLIDPTLKVAALTYSVQLLNGSNYTYSGFGAEKAFGPWKVGATTMTVNLGGTSQVTQYATGINYTLAPGARAYFEINSLGATNGSGDDVEFGFVYVF
jgi:hypothetical protein